MPEPIEPIIGMCSRCRWLAYCEERIGERGFLQLICDECRAAEDSYPMLPIQPLPPPRPPGRETGDGQGWLFGWDWWAA